MMDVDERIRYLLRAATRAEGQGDLRIAHNFRRMADEVRPLDGAAFDAALTPSYGVGD